MSELALRLITENQAAHARGEDATYLDLGKTGLTELPNALFNCTWLETLIVSNRYWDWQQRKWIESPNRGNENLLNVIPAGMEQLKDLKTLYLGGDNRGTWPISDGHFLEKLTQLQALYLSSNQISDGRFLENLSQLKALYLSYNPISDGHFLEKLPQLKILDLSSNQIRNGNFFISLSQLQTLYLSDNKISDGHFLEKLPQLQSLDLSFNQISDWHFLENLSQLKALYLSSNKISDGHFLKNLDHLQSLDLSFNQISDGHFLKKLDQLQALYLSSNQISDGRFLEKLTQIQSLDLSNNQIGDGRFLEKLSQLQSLDLNNNQISDGRFLKKLIQLQSLHLNNNQISDGRFLEKLTKLQSLDLINNQISNWRFLEKLTQLQSLDLSFNQISDGRFLEKLTKLQSLDLSDNQISDGHFLKKLTQLQSLDLSNNQISDGQFLKNLSQLQSLDLSNNHISDWPLALLENSSLELDVEDEFGFERGKVYLTGNPIQNPPLEVLKQGRAFAIEYLRNKDKRPLNECKVIIVGRGAVGKTSLQKRLFGTEVFSPNEPETHGIRKRCWQGGVHSLDGKDSIKVNFWDFGGQHIQQALHQFFYSKNTLYILVLDRRKDENPEDFLELMRAYGHDSPVLVVYNHHIDLNNPQPLSYPLSPELDSSLRRKYPNIRRVFGVCCGVENDEGVAALRQYLQAEIPTYQHVREPYPMSWLDIKNQLLNEVKHNYIQYETYQTLCQAKKINEKDVQKGLVGMLDDAGTITYFDRPFSGKYYILNPDWLTAGAYELILSPLTREKRGRINAQDVRAILDKVDTFQYTPSDRGFLLDLMNEFDLCHEYNRHEWLIPSALEGQSKTDLVKFTKQDHRQYALSYPVSLPRSVIHRFIARNVKYAPTEDYWRNGIVVKHPDSATRMYVEADEKDREIRLYISGEHIRDCWEYFRKDFKEFSGQFEYKEMVTYGEDKISYNNLIKLYNRGIQKWYSPDLDQEIDVREVLGMFEKITDPHHELNPPPSPKERININVLKDLMDEGDIGEVFSKLKTLEINDAEISALRNEFKRGTHKTDASFLERLRLTIEDLS